ncbi:hypothetical protein [Spirosoma flavus]
MTSVEKQLFSLQQQVENLHTQVSSLIALTTDRQHDPSISSRFSAPKPKQTQAQVGLSRFRQLQADQ